MFVITSYCQTNPEYDLSIIKDVPREYGMACPDFKDAVVLDIGGHIGCVSALALNSGASKIIYIEPGEPSYNHAKINLAEAIADGRAELHHAGITGKPDIKEITVRYFADGGSMAASKTVAKDYKKREHWRGRPYRYETVPALNFAEMVEKYRPNVIKFDCEGPEHECIMSIPALPDSVRTIIIEWHYTSTEKGINHYLEGTERLKSWGFAPHKEPNLVIYSYNNHAYGANQFFIRPIAWRR